MPCCGQHRKIVETAGRKMDAPPADHRIRPLEECSLCAEKHLATAYALAQERLYEAVNRHRVVGELVLAQWHCHKAAPGLAEQMRDIRHAVQRRKESAVDWQPVIEAMSEFVEKQLEKEG